MKNVTIVSHLSPAEWKASWRDKVIEDTRENMKKTQSQSCYWGHFKNAEDFTLCFHKEFEIKGMSMGLYFNGHLEMDEKGSRITGSYGKKMSANLFLGLGAVLCIAALVGSYANNDREVSIVSSVLLCILILFYMTKPKKGQQRIMKKLEEISFDSKFHHQRYNKPEKKKHKRSMREKAGSVQPVDKSEVGLSGTGSINMVEETDSNLVETAKETEPDSIEMAGENRDRFDRDGGKGFGLSDKK